MTRRDLVPSRPMDLALPGIMRHGSSIKLKGALVDGSVKNFTIQLNTADGIALYMFVPVHGEITLNSLKSGRWELEERHFNSIKPGRNFHIKIKNKHDFMIIKVNGHLICHFYHRDMPNKIKTLALRGDIHVEDVHFKHFKHQQRDGPAVVIHSNLPPPPLVQHVVMPQSQQILVQSTPQTIIQQSNVYPQVVQPVNQVVNQIMTQPQPGMVGGAVAAALMADGPPPYPADEFPTIPQKM